MPAGHPLRAIREVVNEALAGLPAQFQALYSHTGRPSIAPERLLRALLLQTFYSIRLERRLIEELECNLLYRWFVGLGIDDPVWDATVFCKNRDRLSAGEAAGRFLTSLLALPRVNRLLSEEQFSVDGTLIEAWASIKSFRPRDGGDDGDGGAGDGGRNQARDVHGAKWSNETHRSTTDGDARLYRKGRGKEARLSCLGHAMMENRHGLVVDGLVSRATGEAERLGAEVMLIRRPRRQRRITLGADKAYDAADFVATCESFRVTPHVARNTVGRRSNTAEAVAASESCAFSQRARKRIKEVFAWVKTVAGQDDDAREDRPVDHAVNGDRGERAAHREVLSARHEPRPDEGAEAKRHEEVGEIDGHGGAEQVQHADLAQRAQDLPPLPGPAGLLQRDRRERGEDEPWPGDLQDFGELTPVEAPGEKDDQAETNGPTKPLESAMFPATKTYGTYCVLTRQAVSSRSGNGRPTFTIASMNSRGRPQSELAKIVVTLAAMATIAQTG